MMASKTYTIQNLKCGGCATQIISKLSDIEGVTLVQVDEISSTVTFNYENEVAIITVTEALTSMGYPLFDEDNSLGKKAKSYVSCMVGRVKNVS